MDVQLRNWLDGAVAVGTIGLAAATTWLATTSRHATREAYRARIDTSSPRLVVTAVSVDDQIVQPPRVGGASPGDVAPGIPWDMTQYGQALLGLVGHVRFLNEGSTTAWVRLSASDGVDLTAVLPEAADTMAPFLFKPARDEWSQLRPAGAAHLMAVWWRSAREWADSWNANAPPPVATITLTSRDTSSAVEERCDLSFGAYVVMPRSGQDGWMTAAQHLATAVPYPPPSPITRIGNVKRTYRATK